jgi:hypothetical protein
MWGAPIIYLFFIYFVMGIFDITILKNKNKIQSQNRYVVTSVG